MEFFVSAASGASRSERALSGLRAIIVETHDCIPGAACTGAMIRKLSRTGSTFDMELDGRQLAVMRRL